MLQPILVNNTLYFFINISTSYLDNSKILLYNVKCKGKLDFKTYIILFAKTYKKRGNIKMIFNKKRDINKEINLKQEIFEDAIHESKILKIICTIQTILIVGLCIAFIIKGA